MTKSVNQFVERNVPERLQARFLLRKNYPQLLRKMEPFEHIISDLWLDHIKKNRLSVENDNVEDLKTGFVKKLEKSRIDSSLLEDPKLFQGLICGNESIGMVDALIFVFELARIEQANGLGLYAIKDDDESDTPKVSREMLTFVDSRLAFVKAEHFGDTSDSERLKEFSDWFDPRVGEIFREIVLYHRGSKPGRPLPLWKDIDAYSKIGLKLETSGIKVPPLDFFTLKYGAKKTQASINIVDFYKQFFKIPEEISKYELSRINCKDLDVLLHNLMEVYSLKLQEAKKAHSDITSGEILVEAPTSDDIEDYGAIPRVVYSRYYRSLDIVKQPNSIDVPYIDWFNEKAGIPKGFLLNLNAARSVSV